MVQRYDANTGLPLDKTYLELDLPIYLQESIKQMQKTWQDLDNGIKNSKYDLDWCELNADIGTAESNQEISETQAWYLREKYLRMERETEIL